MGGGVTWQGEVTRLFFQLSFYFDHVHMRSGVPHRAGLPGQLGAVFAVFVHVNTRGGVTSLTGVSYSALKRSLPFLLIIDMTSHAYTRGEVFLKQQLLKITNGYFDQGEIDLLEHKKKSSDKSKAVKGLKKAKKSPKSLTWSCDRVVLLVQNLKRVQNKVGVQWHLL